MKSKKNIIGILLFTLIPITTTYASMEAIQGDIPGIVGQLQDVFTIGGKAGYIFLGFTLIMPILILLKPTKKIWHLILIVMGVLSIFPIADGYIASKTSNSYCKYMNKHPMPKIMPGLDVSWSSSNRDAICIRNTMLFECGLFIYFILFCAIYRNRFKETNNTETIK